MEGGQAPRIPGFHHLCSRTASKWIYFKGPAVEILKSSLDNLLEERLVAEAPWMMYQGGYYYLFYSSAWTTEMKYHIRVAVSKSVYGPFHRSHTPVITTDWKTL